MHWKLIYLIAVYRAFAASVTETEALPAGAKKIKEREIGDHSLQQIKRVLNLNLKPIFGSKSLENLLGRGEMEEANFDEMCGVVAALGFDKFANILSDKLTKKSKTNRLIEAAVFDIRQKYKNFDEKLTNYLSLMNNLKASEEEEASEANVENMGAEKYSSEMFALFLFSRICEEMLELTENNDVSCTKQKADEIIFKNNFLNKMRRKLYKSFEVTKRKMLRILIKDGEQMEQLTDRNDFKFEVQKTNQRTTFDGVTKNIQNNSEIAQMRREFSLFFQTFEEMHSFKRDKIYEAASENKEIRIQLGQMNVAGKAFQIANLQIRLSLLEGIERPMTENEKNSLIFDAENGENFELISPSKLLIDAFVEQKEMNGAKVGKFIQFLSKIKYLKLEELFTILLDSEFKYTAHKTSLVSCLNSVKNSIEEKFNTENLWEYLSKFKEFGLDIESLRKTEATANEFANLSFYAKLYKSFFSQFFSGQKSKSVMKKCPKNFTENLSPEEYVAYWLVEVGKALRKHLVSARQKLVVIIEENFINLEGILKENLDKKVKQLKSDYKKMRKDERNENIQKMKEKYAQEIKTQLAMAWTVNGTLMDKLPLEEDL